MTILATAVGADPPPLPRGVSANGHLHRLESSGLFTHSTWADDFALVANNSIALQIIPREFHTIVQKHGPRVAEKKIHLWSLERPDQISAAGRELQAGDELIRARSQRGGGRRTSAQRPAPCKQRPQTALLWPSQACKREGLG